jgi:DNA adenine methylase
MKPLISYYGGKQRLAKWIISHFPEHRSYIEPFCGGAAVFFAKEPVQLNVLNDTNGAVVNLYRQAKLQPDALFRLIDATPHSRAEYARACEIYKGNVDAEPVEQAWAVYVASMQAFGNVINGGWAFQKKAELTSKGRELSIITSMTGNHKTRLPEILEHLDKAQIDSIDALKCIERYNDPDALFYIDPPYIGTDMGDYAGYTQSDFDALLNLLPTIKGTFFLSHYANAEMERIAEANGWLALKKDTSSTVSAGRNGAGAKNKRVELLVTNHKPQALVP